MFNRFRGCAAVFLVACTGLLVSTARAQEGASAASAAKVDQLAKASGYDFARKNDTVWAADFQGKNLKSFRLVVAVQDDVMVTFVTLVEKARVPETTAFMHKLLHYNSTLDRVKIGLDDDGDLFVRCDASVRAVDSKEFHAIVDQVSAATDEVYKGIASALSPV